MSFFDGKKVLVTGGAGFIGSHLVERLLDEGASVRITVRDPKSPKIRQNLGKKTDQVEAVKADLTQKKDCKQACTGIDFVFNLASAVGSISFNKDQWSVLTQNMEIGSNMISAAVDSNVERFLVMSSSFVYSPKFTASIREDQGFVDDPDKSKIGYGWSKRFQEIAGRVAFEQFGLKTAIVRPSNVYGPRDDFSEKGLIIPTFIRHVFNAEDLTIYGEGKQKRDFIFVDDVVTGLMLAIEKYPVADPVNLASHEEVSIIALANKIMAISGKKVQIHHNPAGETGAMQRHFDTSKAKEKTGFSAKISIDQGLRKTIDWYNKSGNAPR